jgi:hypothetical protein
VGTLSTARSAPRSTSLPTPEPSVTHSHLPVAHLLEQVARFEPRRGDRDPRPAWVTGLINHAADLFDPFAGDVGRVGFDCQFADDRWIVGLYLGGTELVGGLHDGEVHYTDFRFDLLLLRELFDEVDQMQFVALPVDEDHDTRASVQVEGRVAGEAVRLQVYAVPPTDAGPAFRVLPDGTCRPV